MYTSLAVTTNSTVYLIFPCNVCRGEGALCVAAGNHWAAVATTKNRLRLFSSAGLQQSILCLSGPVVTMVGSGPHLAIVHHGANPFALTQNLIYVVLDVAQVLQHTYNSMPHFNPSQLRRCSNDNFLTLTNISTLGDYGGKRTNGTYTRVNTYMARF